MPACNLRTQKPEDCHKSSKSSRLARATFCQKEGDEQEWIVGTVQVVAGAW